MSALVETQSESQSFRLPDVATLQHASKLSIVEDKPIMMDYWTQSLEKTVLIGVKENQEKLLVKSEKKLRRFQKALSRKKKGSNNRKKAVFKVAKLHETISDQRQDFLHKSSLTIVKNFKIISVENLQIKNMVKNHHLAKSISDAGWGYFVSMLSYKVEKTGGKVIKVNPRNTSKTCSECKHVQDMPLSKRTFKCEKCGLILDRDVNAAINIDTVGLTEIQACGDRVRPSAMKAVAVEAGTKCEGNV